MVRQIKSKKPERVGKGKVTPVQIAFIVDRYLSDNSFNRTRTAFRSEASHLIAKSPVQEAPKTLLSLGEIFDEYITLKEQKVWMDQERCRMEHEKLRAQNLLRGMQDAINAYGGTVSRVVTPSPQLPPPVLGSGVQAEHGIVTPAGYYPMQNSLAVMSTSRIQTHSTNFSTPVSSHTTIKRKGPNVVPHSHVPQKKSRSCTQPKGVSILSQSSNLVKNRENNPMSSAAQSSALDDGSNRSPVQGSNVVKCLFNQKPQSPPANSSVPKTPPLESLSQTDTNISPLGMHSTATSSKAVATPQKIMSTNCTIISSETIRVSPNKQISYYSVERNRCLSTCSPAKGTLKRSNVKDHVKGRLDFGASDVPMITESLTPDGTSTSESDIEGNILDLDFPSLDALGWDFNFSELLVDFDIESEGLGLSPHKVLDSSPDSNSGLPPTSRNVAMDDRQVTSQFSSTMAGILRDQDMNLAGPDSIAAVRSVTQCIILSPVKSQRNTLDQENLPAGD